MYRKTLKKQRCFARVVLHELLKIVVVIGVVWPADNVEHDGIDSLFRPTHLNCVAF